MVELYAVLLQNRKKNLSPMAFSLRRTPMYYRILREMTLEFLSCDFFLSTTPNRLYGSLE
jgi:hypothetical protein